MVKWAFSHILSHVIVFYNGYCIYLYCCSFKIPKISCPIYSWLYRFHFTTILHGNLFITLELGSKAKTVSQTAVLYPNKDGQIISKNDHKWSLCLPFRFRRQTVFAMDVCPFVTKSCLPCNLTIIWDIFTKFYRNVNPMKHHAEHKNHNYGLPTFEGRTLWTL